MGVGCQCHRWGQLLRIGLALWGSVAVTHPAEFRSDSEDTISRPLFRILGPQGQGRALLSDSLARVLHKYDLPWRSYIGLSELLLQSPLLTVLHTGEAAGWHLLAFGRVPPQGVGLSLNGRPWQEPTFGVLSPELYPPEFIEKVELLKGTEATVLGWNALGIGLNIVEPEWKTGYLHSRLWYLNAAYGVGGSDGMLLLVPHPRWEVVAGYRRLSSDGRFPNGWSSGWNTRVRLRWTPTPTISIAASELFTHWVMGLNGGMDAAASPAWWDELTARPVSGDCNARLYRHDVTLTTTWHPSSGSAIVGQIWYTPTLWQWRLEDGFRDTAVADFRSHVRWHNWQAGARFHWELSSAQSTLWAAGLVGLWGYTPELPFAQRSVQRQLAGYLLQRFAVWGIRVQAGVRLLFDGVRLYSGGGAGASGVFADGWWWRWDFSQSVRLPLAIGNGAAERLWQIWGEMGWRSQSWQGELGIVGQRLLSSPSGAVSRSVFSLSHLNPGWSLLTWTSLRASLPFGWVGFSGVAQPVAEHSWRTFRTVATVGSERQVGESQVQVELCWELLRAPALRALPPAWPLQPVSMPRVWHHSGGEFRLAARLGMAYLRLCLRNLFDTAWYRMPWYPQPGRSLLFELNWSFSD
ncbi:MAG: hypothetical protein RMK93_04930 [Bacteroidota bacterium]|nr:hypothetical protein [Bacteroidota bacterium]